MMNYIQNLTYILNYFSTSIPIFFAVPAIDFMIDSMSSEFISDFLRVAISSKSFFESFQILILFGSADHDLRLSFHKIKFDVTGLPILRSKDLSA